MRVAPKTWEPILSDSVAREARESIAEIAHDIEAICQSRDTAVELAESALLFAYLGKAECSAYWTSRAIRCLDLAVENFRGSYVALYGGITQAAWIVEHLSNSSDLALAEAARSEEEEEDRDALEQVDQFLKACLAEDRGFRGYDLISGLVGLGVYFLERLPRSQGKAGVEIVLDRLLHESKALNPGRAWYTPPELLPDYQLKEWPSGYYNLGVAHGILGVVCFLAKTVAAGIETEKASALLEQSVRWLFAQSRPPSAVTRFSSWVYPGTLSGNSRLGWCYGDLGIGAVLRVAADRYHQKDWSAYGSLLLDRCIDFPEETACILDAELCHGAMGVGHIFNRAYQISSETRLEYREAANNWFQRGLEMRQPGRGVGGYLSYKRPNPAEGPIWESDSSFLSGAIGIALALISATYPLEPGWDRILLLS